MQTFLVIIIVVLSIWYLVRYFVKSTSNAKGKGGCSGCKD